MLNELTITKEGYTVTKENCTTCNNGCEPQRNWNIKRHSSMIKDYPIIVNGEIVDEKDKIWKIVLCLKYYIKHSELFVCEDYA